MCPSSKVTIALSPTCLHNFHRFGQPVEGQDRDRFFNILEISAKHRTAEQIAFVESFVSRVPYFRDVPSTLVTVACREMTLKHHDINSMVCRVGDPGGTLYVFATGGANVRRVSCFV
jgi:hypothetical protein